MIRVKTTINDPRKFLVFRHKQEQAENEPKQRFRMRKGVRDIPLRAAVSQHVNNRFMDDLATLQDATPVLDFINEMTSHGVKAGRRFRALDPTGKDLEIPQAISNPPYKISGLTNKMLREHLSGKGFGARRTEKQLSAKGLRYRGKVHGINVNRLTKNTRRDRLAATPLHRYVPCRFEKVTDE